MFCFNGYGGRATDEMIVSHSGFLDNLQPGMEIMVNRGLKTIATMVLERRARLVRPPSVSEEKQLSKDQVLTGRRIAGVRIHVERAIRRICEFRFIGPHAHLHRSLIKHADDVCFLLCGLGNLQSCLIRC